MKARQKVTGLTKTLATFGAAVGAGAVFALGFGRTGGHAEELHPPSSAVAQPAISAPALTTADLAAVRDEVRQVRTDNAKDIADLRDEMRRDFKALREGSALK